MYKAFRDILSKRDCIKKIPTYLPTINIYNNNNNNTYIWNRVLLQKHNILIKHKNIFLSRDS